MTSSQALKFTAILLTVTTGAWALYTFGNPYISEKIQTLTTTTPIERIIHTPAPLRYRGHKEEGTLTADGTFAETNVRRTENDLPALQRNSTLDAAAQLKLEDMFAQQYFEHVSPDGRGPSDVVDTAGYAYITVGENLALGIFESDQELVQAWMDSPGHRANILSDNFEELGIAVGRGQFNGKTTWLAVQTFGTPLSNCTPPDSSLHEVFEQERQSIESLQKEIDALRNEIDTQISIVEALFVKVKQLAAEGNHLIEQGNANIQKGNEVYEETGSREQAQPYWDKGEAQQKEGQELLSEAQKKQDEANSENQTLQELQSTHNTLIEQYSTQNNQVGTSAETYNQQVRTFNACVQQYQ